MEQKVFEISILKGFSNVQDLLKDVSNEIQAKGYGEGWYLKKLEMLTKGVYQIIVERVVE